jgi:hypothetical protein
MFRDLKTQVRAKGASDPLLQLLEEEGLLDWQRMEGVLLHSLQATVPSVQPSTGQNRGSAEGASSNAKAGRRAKLRPTRAPQARLQILAAIALSYL